MKKIIRNRATPEGRAFWDSALRSAKEVRNWPDWKKAGVTAEPPGILPHEAAPTPVSLALPATELLEGAQYPRLASGRS